ncbi:MAG: trypsin-like peptidase domain-containing protein [Acidimicrobiales bacterium]
MRPSRRIPQVLCASVLAVLALGGTPAVRATGTAAAVEAPPALNLSLTATPVNGGPVGAPTALPPVPPKLPVLLGLLERLLTPLNPSPPTPPTVPGTPGTPGTPSPFNPFIPGPTPGPAPAPDRSTPAPTTPTPRTGPAASAVKVSGNACGLRLDGSGFSPERDTVITNAHVVAGVAEPVVIGSDGRARAARVVVFDPGRDVAVLVVPGLGQPPITLAASVPPQPATVLGHPLGQAALRELSVTIDGRQVANVPDIYRSGVRLRENLVMRGEVRQGDSGGAVVDGRGAAVGMVFATDANVAGRAFAIPSEDLGFHLAQPRGTAVSTGPCLAGS